MVRQSITRRPITFSSTQGPEQEQEVGSDYKDSPIPVTFQPPKGSRTCELPNSTTNSGHKCSHTFALRAHSYHTLKYIVVCYTLNRLTYIEKGCKQFPLADKYTNLAGSLSRFLAFPQIILSSVQILYFPL